MAVKGTEGNTSYICSYLRGVHKYEEKARFKINARCNT